MSIMRLRAFTLLPGLVMLVQAVFFVIDPEQALKGVGMPLLDGIARSTQIGDIGSIFVFGACLISYAVYRLESHWLKAGAWMMSIIAIMRFLAWYLHGAALTLNFIIVEIILAGWLLISARAMDGLSGIGQEDSEFAESLDAE